MFRRFRASSVRLVLPPVACCCALVAARRVRRGSIQPRCSSRRPTAGRRITATTPASRHSRLTQITPDNVHQLTLAWTFQTGQRRQSRRRPSSSTASCISRRRTTSGRSTRAPAVSSGATRIRPIRAFHIGHRGAAVYKDSVYLTTPDAHLVALDAQNGKVKWDVVIADAKQGLLVDERAAARPQPPAGRRLRRLRQSARHAEVGRSRNRQDAVDLLQHAAAGHARFDRAAAPPADRCGTPAPTIPI